MPGGRRQPGGSAASASSPSPDCRSANGDRHERPTPSSACTRSSSAGSRRRPCCPRPRRRPCCSGRCWHPARSRCARSTAGRPWPSPPRRSRLTSPPDPTTLPAPETTLSQFQPHPRRHLILKESGVGIPNLLVVLFSPQPVILLSGAPPTPDVLGDRLGSVITGQ